MSSATRSRCGQRFTAGCLTLLWVGAVAGEPVSAASSAPRIKDPFSYCARVGTDDRVGLASDGPMVAVLVPSLRSALGLPSNAPAAPPEIFWRCMNTKVYACIVGANLPCGSKADTSKHNSGAESFCREHPDAGDVPAYATGHASIYAWRCAAGRAVRGAAVAGIDRRGFRRDVWHALRETRGGPP